MQSTNIDGIINLTKSLKNNIGLYGKLKLYLKKKYILLKCNELLLYCPLCIAREITEY